MSNSNHEEELTRMQAQYRDIEHPTIGWLLGKAWKSFSIDPWMHIANFIIYAILDLLLFCTLIGNLARPALYGGYMESMMRLARGQKVKIGDFIQYGFKPPFSTLIGAGWILIAAMLIGLILLTLPIYYIFTIWFFVFPLILDEKIGIVDAFRKSKLMTKGSFWKVFPKFLVTLALFATGLGIPLAVLIKVHYYFALSDVENPTLKPVEEHKEQEPVKTAKRNTTITPLSDKILSDESSPQIHQDTGVDCTDSKQVETKLTMYKEMEREGLISKEDYQKLKRKLLGL